MSNHKELDKLLDKLPDSAYHQRRYLIRRGHPYYWQILGTVVGAIVILLCVALMLQLKS